MSCHISHIKLKKNKIEFITASCASLKIQHNKHNALAIKQYFYFASHFNRRNCWSKDDENFNSNGKQDSKKDLKTEFKLNESNVLDREIVLVAVKKRKTNPDTLGNQPYVHLCTLVYSIRLIPTNEGQMFSKKSRRLIFFLKLKSRQLFRNACMYSTQNSSFPSPSGIDVIFP